MNGKLYRIGKQIGHDLLDFFSISHIKTVFQPGEIHTQSDPFFLDGGIKYM